MDKEKEKKKTLTISTNLKKKIDTSSLSKKENIKSYSINSDKKNIFKTQKNTRRNNSSDQNFKNQVNKSKKFTRKFVEQQATKVWQQGSMKLMARSARDVDMLGTDAVDAA